MELTVHLEVEQLIVCRPAFAPVGGTLHFDIFRHFRNILQSQPQHLWAERLAQQPEFQSLAETAPHNQDTYLRLLKHLHLQELMIWMDALETKVMTITGQEQDALHPSHFTESVSHQIPHATLNYVASGLSSEDAYRESMQHKSSSTLTS